MRTLEINKRNFAYAIYEGMEPIKDSQGFETGEFKKKYSFPVSVRGHISITTGQTIFENYGTVDEFERVIVLDDINCPITEGSAIWIDADTSEPFDYVVRKVARSLNNLLIAVSKVKMSA